MKKIIYIFLLIVVLLFVVYSSSYDRSEPLMFTSPDHNVDFYFSNLLLTNNNFFNPIPYYDYLPKDVSLGFTIRDGVQDQGFNIPKRFVTPLYLISILNLFHLQLYFVPLVSVFLILIIFLFVKRQFGFKPAVISSLLVALFPAFWINSIWITSDTMISFLFLFLGMFYLSKFRKEKKILLFYLFLIFIAISLYLRPTTIFFVFFSPFLLNKKNWRKILRPKVVLISLLIIVMISFPLFYLNNTLYGHPLNLGYDLASDIEKELLGEDYPQKKIFEYGRITSYIKSYFSIFLPTFMLFLLAIVYSLKEKINIKLLIYFLLTISISIIYFGGQQLWGLEKVYINSSFLRYILPIFIILFIILSVYLSKLNKKLLVLIMFFLIITYTLIAITFPGGIMWQNQDISSSSKIKTIIQEKTSQNSIIISALSGKYLFPERKVITVSFWTSKFIRGDDDKHFWKRYPDEKELARKVNILYNVNSNLFILKDQQFFNDQILEKELEFNNLNLILIDGEANLYKITKNETTN